MNGSSLAGEHVKQCTVQSSHTIQIFKFQTTTATVVYRTTQ